MIKVYLKKQSKHAINTTKTKSELRKFLKNKGISSYIVDYLILREKAKLIFTGYIMQDFNRTSINFDKINDNIYQTFQKLYIVRK